MKVNGVLLMHGSIDEAEGATDNASKVVNLAREKFGTLSHAEEKLFEAAANGKVADYSADSKEDNDPAGAKKWGDERTLKADRIAWLCTDPQASALVSYRGIQVKGARIDGELDLLFAKIPFPLVFEKSAFPGQIIRSQAKVCALFLSGTHTGSIFADGVKVEGDVFLRDGFKAEGEVRLLSAKIGGNLDCENGQFINPGRKALNAGGMNVKGSILLRNGFKAKGTVSLETATIDGSLECDNGRFINPKDAALTADGLDVGRNVFLNDGFEAKGEVRLSGATIGGQLDCSGGQFINKNKEGRALSTDDMNVQGSIFLSNGFKAEGSVCLLGATIGGHLECENGQLMNPGGDALSADRLKVESCVHLCNGFKAQGQVCLLGARIGGSLNCGKGQFINPEGYAFNGDGLRVEGFVFLGNGFKAEGEVRLYSATIGEYINCDAGQFINKNKEASALFADGVKVEGGVFLRKGFRAEGEVRLLGATIGGNLECDEGQFINPSGDALNADAVKVDGYVFLRNGFKAEGEVCLLVARIGRNLECDNGHFINKEKGAKALNADGLKVEGDVLLRNGFRAEGKVYLGGATIGGAFVWTGVTSPTEVTLDLRSAKIGTLWDDQKSWPEKGKLFFHGLVYGEIDDDAPIDAKTRIDWLHRQPTEHFRTQPYEQLAAVLRKGGHDTDAKKILIAKAKDQARLTQLTWSEKCWYHVFGKFIGYGYRPWRAFWIGLLVVALGWGLFRIGLSADVMTPTKKGAYVSDDGGENRRLSEDYPKFHALVYSLDMFVPLVNLHQASYWLPNANREGELRISEKLRLSISGGLLRIYLWVHIVMGWVLTTLLVVGLSGLIRNKEGSG